MIEPPGPNEEPLHHGPPIPPPTAYSCPHCSLEMVAPVPYCPRCGAGLHKRGSSAGCVNIGLAIFLGALALPSALMGGCFLLFGSTESEFSLTAYGLLGIGFAALCVWGIVRLLKARQN